ncbi:hypothetical protein QWT69_16040 [Sporosarcina oncorhynchi]|uniref:Uncharacterized protein n=1 Tax=Sporosarcina oncorhynchi TaxID=3056444 RepID=A0ABZ0L413_9BACL|nr:hypothetical protein [Sporosarcina sp. T2O-4]WOV87340.1 hypothetical protein QWT69_16040 [Sporosarcina sp. T2O-4]
MERPFIDPVEMKRRQDRDFMASLNMIDEGAPVHYPAEKHMLKWRESTGFTEHDLPQTYQ